jgi:hypothetical protein
MTGRETAGLNALFDRSLIYFLPEGRVKRDHFRENDRKDRNAKLSFIKLMSSIVYHYRKISPSPPPYVPLDPKRVLCPLEKGG